MEKYNILIIALLFLILIGFLHSRTYEPTTTTSKTKTVVVKNEPNYRYYGANPNYNPYKAKYYN